MTTVRAKTISAFRLLCSDPAATARFYESTFGARRSDKDGHLVLGHQPLTFDAGQATATPYPPSNATSFQHFAIVVSDMRAAMARLEAAEGWTAISRHGPERLPASSGGVTAFKFRDPDGHPLELLAFPGDAAPSPWRRLAGLFLGIDHSAITVADTERSIAFYAGLGFRVGSRGINRGGEQARLDAVDDPLVEVTSVTPPGGAPPHVELLCYRRPGVVDRPVPDGDALATTILIREPPSNFEGRDPDGHRLSAERSVA